MRMLNTVLTIGGITLLPTPASAQDVSYNVRRHVSRPVYELQITRHVYVNDPAPRYAVARPCCAPAVVAAPVIYAPPLCGPVAIPTYPLPTTSAVIYNRPLVWVAGWPATAGYGYFGR